LRITIKVRPGSNRPSVGGSFDGALVVRVKERAVDGQATEAALGALAAALGLRSSDVALVTGATSTTKVVDLSGDPAELSAALALLSERVPTA
jgi:hypothetical protein